MPEHRRLRSTLLVAGIAAACAHPPIESRAQRPETRTSELGTSAVPVLEADAPAGNARSLERHVWTTRPDADACDEFRVTEAPAYSQFDTRAECEAWVARRSCRPGFSCFDGCNTHVCDPTGMHETTTLVDCRMQVAATIEFHYASLVLVGSPPPELVPLQAALAQVLDAPHRKLIVVGHAGAAEAKTDAARVRLAARRADVVRRLLVEGGLPGDRVFARPAGAHVLPPATQSAVSFELDPDHPTRDDVDAEARRGRRWCGDGTDSQSR